MSTVSIHIVKMYLNLNFLFVDLTAFMLCRLLGQCDTLTAESCTNGATTLSHMNFSGHVGHI